MGINYSNSLAVLLAMMVPGPAYCVQQPESERLFGSVSVETNAVYTYCQPTRDSCTLAETAKYTRIENCFMTDGKLRLSLSLAYAHLRSLAAAKRDAPVDARGLKYMNGSSIANRSKPMPINFSFQGVPCLEYEVSVIPFKIVNESEVMEIEEALVKFFHKGAFRFALYANLNDCMVTPKFKDGTKSHLLLYYISTYPFLDRDECLMQNYFISEINHSSQLPQIGCQARIHDSWGEDNLPRQVGGIPIDAMVGEKAGCGTMEVIFGEIVLSNDFVMVSGTFTGPSGPRFKIDPNAFMGALSCTILSAEGIGRPFRLVGESEFCVASCLSWDQVFASSQLYGGGNTLFRFYCSFRGFPSDSEVRSDKAGMDISSRLYGENAVGYFMKRIAGVRFCNQDYRYPNEDHSWINIKGSGVCPMRVVRALDGDGSNGELPQERDSRNVMPTTAYSEPVLISEVCDPGKFVEVCRAEVEAMRKSGVECVDGRQYAGPLRSLAPQILLIRQSDILDIQLKGGFSHKGLLVDVGEAERQSVSHPRFKTSRIMNRVYLYDENQIEP